jgi:acyl-CoA thioesterase I
MIIMSRSIAALFVLMLTACQPAAERPDVVPLDDDGVPAETWTGSAAPASAGDATAVAPDEGPDVSPRMVLFLGTSLTAGYGIGEQAAFPALIQQKIDSAGLPFRVSNAGISGETSAGGLRRIDWSLQQPVDVLVLELGANDGLRGLPVEQLRSNLDQILRRARARYPDIGLVLIGMEAPPNLGARYTTEFRSVFVELARRYDAALVPFLLEGVAAQPALNLEDGIHPNPEGHRIVAESVWGVLEPLLRGRG